MKNKLKITIIFSTIILLGVFSLVKNSQAAWQEDLEGQFDIAETFDGLQNWKGKNGLHGYTFTPADQPKKLDGSQGMWDFYSDWSYTDPAENWIADFGPSKVWGGSGKSLRMDLSFDSQHIFKGPSRFGLYFGSDTTGQVDPYSTTGLEDSGLKDIYYFYMVKLPYNMFPTDGGGTWPNDTYPWWGYHKFAVMSAGSIALGNTDDTVAGAGGCRWEYSCSYVLTELKKFGSGGSGLYEDTFQFSHDLRIVDYFSATQTWIQGYDPAPEVHLKQDISQDRMNNTAYQGKWFGIEYHVNIGTAGNYDGTIETWIYDEDGTAHLAHQSNGYMFEQAETDLAYNKFEFGGNISYQAQVDSQGLDTTYYVDDFIIDNSRIGPAYFNLLNSNSDITAPSAPLGLNVL